MGADMGQKSLWGIVARHIANDAYAFGEQKAGFRPLFYASKIAFSMLSKVGSSSGGNLSNASRSATCPYRKAKIAMPIK